MAPEYRYLSTPDGRTLEYQASGPEDGRPLLFHVGTPNCATEFSVITEPAAALGLRVITYSRPGYGDSTEQPGRTVADAIADVTAVLDAAEVAEFLTLGWSGGGPHALTCAALLPERCQAAAVLAGVAPYDAHSIDFLAGMDQMNIDEFGAAAHGRAELEAFINPLLGHFTAVTAQSVVESMAGLLPPVDQQALTGRFAEQMAATFRHAMKHGPAGWRDDDLAFVADWGFACTDISVPVAIWQGRQDRMVPFDHGQWLAAEIPSAEPHLFTEEGHLSLISQAGLILSDLIALADAR
jgi:pimeloyl-ACP methyl ester carboxylesterase